MRELDRRTAIKTLGVAASFVGSSGLAAAQGEGEEEGAEEGDSPEFEEWFENTEGFEDTVDETEEDEVIVTVGAGDEGYDFEPAAVRITEETTVRWEWTDSDDQHDVTHQPEAEAEVFEDVSEDDIADDGDVEDGRAFQSDLVEGGDHTFEHEFESGDGGRTYLYVCTAHEVEGMRGAVIVDAGDGDGNGGGGSGDDGDGNSSTD